MSGTFTFRWSHPEATEVWVTGTFDDWTKSVQLDKVGDIFEKTVELPAGKKVLYKFVVDDNWVLDHTKPSETDEHSNTNNVLHPTDISLVTLSSSGAGSTTAALAGQVPKEDDKTSNVVPGAFIETPAVESENAFSVNPIPHSTGATNPVKLAPGEQVPPPTNELGSAITLDKEAYENSAGGAAPEDTFAVNPIPATTGGSNPIKLAPGESVPHSSSVTSNTVGDTVTLDKESYEKASSTAIPATTSATSTSVTDAKATVIPESGLPVGAGAYDAGIAHPFVSGIGSNATTVALAAQVPLENSAVPATVTESQKAAEVPPEASANPAAVVEKQEVEEELKAKVPEAAPTSESSSTGLTAGGIAAAVAGTATAAAAAVGGAAFAAKEKATQAVSSVTTVASGIVPPSEEKNVAPPPPPVLAAGVPEVVKESLKAADESPEAAANPEAVIEKSAVEAELEQKVKTVEATGEPAPTTTSAVTETSEAPAAADETPESAHDLGDTPTSKKNKRKSIMLKVKKVLHIK